MSLALTLPHNEYLLDDLIGSGTYGVVRKVISDGLIYAAKIPKSRNEQYFDSVMEISSLMSLRNAVNVASIRDISYNIGPDSLHPGIILSLYDSDANKYMPQSREQLKSAMFDICNGMLSLYNKNILHLDLKSNNILFSIHPPPYGRYFIADFGTSLKTFDFSDETSQHSCYVQSLLYRAPEVALGRVCGTKCIYNYTIDLWAIGIMMGEFGNQPYNPKWQHPIFIAMYNAKRRGDTDMDTILLSTLYQLFGPPNTETCLKILDVPLVDTRSLFPYMTDEEYSFMMLFLKINPKERPSFQQIFDHSYLNGYMPTEPSNMSSLNKIKSMDWLSIPPFEKRNKTRTKLIEWIIIRINKYQKRDIYFSMLSIFDYYITHVTDLRQTQYLLIMASAIVISTYMTEGPPFRSSDASTMIHNKFTPQEIDTSVLNILKLFDYSLHFSTEKEYLDAYLDTMSLQHPERTRIQDEVYQQLISASKSPYFRSYSKEVIVSTMISRFILHPIPDTATEMLLQLENLPTKVVIDHEDL